MAMGVEQLKKRIAGLTKISGELRQSMARAFLDGIQVEALDVTAAPEAGMRAAVGDKLRERLPGWARAHVAGHRGSARRKLPSTSRSMPRPRLRNKRKRSSSGTPRK